jgi:hypothetical protein
MAKNQINPDSFSRDILEFLVLLHHHLVRYLIVGGQAVIYHGYARLTGDIDIFYSLEESNVIALHDALSEFWSGHIPEIDSWKNLAVSGQIIQFGIPPNRIDLINRISGVRFDDAWAGKTTAVVSYSGTDAILNFIGLSDLIANKTSSKRPKDLDDLRYLTSKLQ